MNEIEDKFKHELVSYMKNETECDINSLLSYSFYLLTTKNDDLSLYFAYLIVLLFSVKESDFQALSEFSIIFGFSPVLKMVADKKGVYSSEMQNLISEFYINNNYYKEKLLTSGQKILYRLINEKNDYSVVAPTSYGKTDLMIESAFISKFDSVIIVPLVALLGQVKNDIQKYSKANSAKIKVITHHEIKPSRHCKNIFVLTQERCYQILKTDAFSNVSDLFIDESHKLLVGDKRSYKLSEIIYLLKRKYNVAVKYYSPVLYDAGSIKIKGIHKDNLIKVQEIRDMKNYLYFLYHDNKQKLYIPNTQTLTSKYVVSDNYNGFFDYIIKNSKCKNILFYNSPKDIEKKAIELSYEFEDRSDINVTELSDFVGTDYYIVETLKHGIVYIHGQMPEIIRFYLLDLYRNNPNVNYIVTNSSILEGVNTPSDNLFICDYKIGGKIMRPMDFINLRGRINRLKDIVESGDESRLLCETHFFAEGSRCSKIRKELIDTIYNKDFTVDITNPFLENASGITEEEKEDYLDSLKKIKTIDETANIEEDFGEDILEESESVFLKICLMNDISLNDIQKISLQENCEKYYGSNINSIIELLNALTEIFNLGQSNFFELSRLSIIEARKFYSMLLEWLIQGKSIREKADRMTSYYQHASKTELIYVGKSRGDIAAEVINGTLYISENCKSRIKYDKNGYPQRLNKVWIKNTKNKKELYNVCITKIKIEEDFISYYLIPMIESLHEIEKEIIDIRLYKLIKYGTIDDYEISLIKEGLSPYLAHSLNNEKYRNFITIDEDLIIDEKIIEIFTENAMLLNELRMNVY